VETFVRPVKEHRFVVVFRHRDLTDGIADTDPQQVGLEPLPAVAERPEAEATADLINDWLAAARKTLAGHHPANMVTLRGFAKTPTLPQIGDVFKLKCAAIATYPMYRGVARLVGMDLLPTGDTIASEFETLKEHFSAYDFVYLHIKKTDSYGEDGNFDAKVHIIQELDEFIPSLMALKPDVVTATGDHSTPALLKAHSWHPVPTLIWSAYGRTDGTKSFGETECTRGGLGHFYAPELMRLLMANALRLAKFGA
jgi:2,3-bisphosphoglycerate-independent phosphoglycerate mutase